MTRRPVVLYLFALSLCFASFGCGAANMIVGQITNQVRITGSGVAAKEIREVAEFDKLRVRSALHVNVTVGGEPAIVVTADDNVVSLVQTELKNNTLSIGMQENTSINAKNKIEVELTVPYLTELDSSGATHVRVSGLSDEEFTVETSGASTVTLSGDVGQLDVDASGASKVDAKMLTAQEITVDASGASSIMVCSTDTVTGDASGASNIAISGTPRLTQVDRSGAAKVHVSAAESE